MQIASGVYNVAQSNVVLVPAEAERIIRVVYVVLSAWSGVKFTLLSDPGGDPVAITAPFYVGGGNGLVLDLGRRRGLITGRGQALGLTTVFQLAQVEHSVVLWYEVVD